MSATARPAPRCTAPACSALAATARNHWQPDAAGKRRGRRLTVRHFCQSHADAFDKTGESDEPQEMITADWTPAVTVDLDGAGLPF